MLKALELVGFKSFADKTRLEFPRGITVVVGPNGSGKSNIVDAIKWVLGEQSVKSLRGKEMADVIFNGSASRKPLNSAETTLTFDNSTRLLALDTPEVHITRRVYRSGEGEYLINREPCRLKDIKELFAGTGVATEAYSVIEQGKVDVLLQASPRERRMIFEEAAGISRFKAKKLEALRRLERVEQNLLRLSDIVDEVENRLRAVRLQAGKARRYKEYADRLQELRTQVGLADWRRLSTQLAEIEAELQAAQDEAAQLTAEAENVEATALSLELQIGECDQSIRTCEATSAENRERIAKEDATIEHERRRSRDLEEEIARHRRQLSAMNVRAGGLEQQLSTTAAQLQAIESLHRETALRLAEAERALTRITAEWDQLRAENERSRQMHLEQLRAAATLGNQISALDARVSSTDLARDRSQRRLGELASARTALGIELEQMRGRLEELIASASQRHQLLRTQQAALADKRRQLARTLHDLAQLRQKHAAAAERALVLEELEKRLEGLSSGVKELLNRARGATDDPLAGIQGVVADLLSVNIETAPLIEVALGEMAQHVVVNPSRLLVDYLQQDAARFSGRVGLIRLDVLPPLTGAEQIDLAGQNGVLGRADRFVETAPEFAVLAKRLLGKTWIVETLSDALTLQQSLGKGLSFVTRACELLSFDGCLAVGPRHTSTGLISRRSELRALRGQIADMSAKITQSEGLCAQLEAQIAAEDLATTQLEAEHQELAEALGQQRLRTGSAEERQLQLDKQHTQVAVELAQATREHDEAATTLTATRERLTQTELSIAEIEQRLGDGTARASELEQARVRHSRETGSAKVELAKSEQQVENLRAQHAQLQRDQQERARALIDARTQLSAFSERATEADRNILRAESATAELYLRKESYKTESVRYINQRETFQAQRGGLLQESQQARGKIRKLESKLHAKGLVAADVRHERTTLVERLREDYGIELAELQHQPTADELVERESIEGEIADLRSKVNSIGGVNLDALSELEELELRFESLSSQYRDLASAKASLEQIIGKINADSRRLFAETLEVVRGHFQTLFRKLFGGGQADIVMDEGVDILDSGIEIVARPPGKEPRNISLLSGGEKTLTCVALLLAIFRSRPSPFCVLDEVDAALDEANIQRFIGVLQEFLAWTQFIVVTHSKKTMTCASTLYGVTMQESGVSKRVSVRFEDVSDTGEINSYREMEEPPAESGKDEAA